MSIPAINWVKVNNGDVTGATGHLTAAGIGDQKAGRFTARIELGVANGRWVAQYKPQIKRNGQPAVIHVAGTCGNIESGKQAIVDAIPGLVEAIAEYTTREYPRANAAFKFFTN